MLWAVLSEMQEHVIPWLGMMLGKFLTVRSADTELRPVLLSLRQQPDFAKTIGWYGQSYGTY